MLEQPPLPDVPNPPDGINVPPAVNTPVLPGDPEMTDPDVYPATPPTDPAPPEI